MLAKGVGSACSIGVRDSSWKIAGETYVHIMKLLDVPVSSAIWASSLTTDTAPPCTPPVSDIPSSPA
jgi:hypothetical protein